MGRRSSGGTSNQRQGGGNIVQRAGRAIANGARNLVNRIRGGNTGTGGRTRG